MSSEERPSFMTDTIRRVASESARVWVVENFLRNGRIPRLTTFFAYPRGPGGFDWGESNGAYGTKQPLKGKRVRITFEVEDY